MADVSRHERGAAALEFGLVSPIVFAVLFGTLTYGLWFNDSLNLRQGLREASRQGVVQNYGSSSSCGMTYSGTAPSTNIKKLMCRAESDVNAMTGDTYVKVVLPERLGARQGARGLRHDQGRAAPGPRAAARRPDDPLVLADVDRGRDAAPGRDRRRRGPTGRCDMDLVRLSRRWRHRDREERGAVAILVAVMTVALFGIAALVADLGQARVVRGEAQAASDASALAAGNALYLVGHADGRRPRRDRRGEVLRAEELRRADRGLGLLHRPGGVGVPGAGHAVHLVRRRRRSRRRSASSRRSAG